MNDHSNSFSDGFSADERDRLEQELLELHFGCHSNAEAIEARLAAEPALRALQRCATSGGNLFEQLMETTRVASLGQIRQALFEVGGRYRRAM